MPKRWQKWINGVLMLCVKGKGRRRMHERSSLLRLHMSGECSEVKETLLWNESIAKERAHGEGAKATVAHREQGFLVFKHSLIQISVCGGTEK